MFSALPIRSWGSQRFEPATQSASYASKAHAIPTLFDSPLLYPLPQFGSLVFLCACTLHLLLYPSFSGLVDLMCKSPTSSGCTDRFGDAVAYLLTGIDTCKPFSSEWRGDVRIAT